MDRAVLCATRRKTRNMNSVNQTTEEVEISVSNIGGIEQTNAVFQPGVTVLAGRNATNRTSLLQAISAGLGSDDVSLKTDAQEGQVKMTINGETFTRTLTRDGNRVSINGEPYLNDSELADLFAFLLESNEARRAVVQKDDLHELIMRPVDTDEIERKIELLTKQKREIDDKLETLDGLQQEIPKLKQELGVVEGKIEKRNSQLEEKEAEIETLDSDIQETRQEKSKLEENFRALRNKRSELEETRSELDRKQESLQSLEQRHSELEEEITDIPETPIGSVQEIESQIDQLRGELQTITETINEIQTIIRFNEEKLDETNSEIAEALGIKGSSSNTVTDRLIGDKQTVCWTCGSSVEKSSIEDTLDQLRDLSQTKLSRKRELNEQIGELEDEKVKYQEKQRQRDQTEHELETIEQKVEQREDRIQTLRARQNELESEVTELEETVESLENEDYSEILDLHKEANQLEFELGRLKDERTEIEHEISEKETRLEKRHQIESEREELNERLEQLRTEVERVEERAVTEFNDHMDTVLSIMEFENLDRIWIERTQKTVREGRKNVSQTEFDLHVVRSTGTDITYEDQIDNLSESERETTGLIFALAGYLVHEVYEEVPFMLLDSLEPIDSDRIATLVEYLSDYAEYLVVALLSEDASAVSQEKARISEI